MPDIIGHKKSIATFEKLADDGAMSHGYIFFGPAMVGKRLVAESLANYLENGDFTAPSRVLGDCEVIHLEKNGSIGIDAVREVKNFLWQRPNKSPRRTLIVDDADRLTTEAQNALLKVTEEPPASSLLVLVTSDMESIMPTILSRLQRVYLGTVPEDEIVAWLKTSHGASAAKAVSIGKRSFGKPGLAVRMVGDEVFEKNLDLAESYVRSAKTARRDLIKKIIDPDDFDLRNFLEAVIMVLASDGMAKKNPALWHKAMALYGRQADFSLNPRLQLEALLM